MQIKIIFRFIFMLLIIFNLAKNSFSNPINPSNEYYQKNREKIIHSYPTKFGDLEFFITDDLIGEPATKIKLNGTDFLLPNQKKDIYGYKIKYTSGNLLQITGLDFFPKKIKSYGNPQTKRLIVEESVDGGCVRQFIILDFTGDRPYISERFGYNPEGNSCLTFLRAKWSKNKSYIYLDGPFTYIYQTGGKIIGPID